MGRSSRPRRTRCATRTLWCSRTVHGVLTSTIARLRDPACWRPWIAWMHDVDRSRRVEPAPARFGGGTYARTPLQACNFSSYRDGVAPRRPRSVGIHRRASALFYLAPPKATSERGGAVVNRPVDHPQKALSPAGSRWCRGGAPLTAGGWGQTDWPAPTIIRCG